MLNGKIVMTTPTVNEIHSPAPDGGAVVPKMAARELNAYFGRTQALKNMSLEMAAKRVTAIIGPSGCGKSTFLRCLNRMHEVGGGTMDGTVLLDGEPVSGYDPVLLRRRVGMVFQKPNPFPTMSIFDNVAAGLKLNSRKSKKELTPIVERCLRRAALWDEVKDSLDKSGISLS